MEKKIFPILFNWVGNVQRETVAPTITSGKANDVFKQEHEKQSAKCCWRWEDIFVQGSQHDEA